MKRLASYCAVGISLATIVVGSVAAQLDPDLNPTFGSTQVRAGAALKPHLIELVAGGPIRTNLGGVSAYVAKAPAYRVSYTAGANTLVFQVKSGADTTLLINLPDGTWIADDDGGGFPNPLVKIVKPKSGRYDIYVGTVAKGNAKATLMISESGTTAADPIRPPPDGNDKKTPLGNASRTDSLLLWLACSDGYFLDQFPFDPLEVPGVGNDLKRLTRSNDPSIKAAATVAIDALPRIRAAVAKKANDGVSLAAQRKITDWASLRMLMGQFGDGSDSNTIEALGGGQNESFKRARVSFEQDRIIGSAQSRLRDARVRFLQPAQGSFFDEKTAAKVGSVFYGVDMGKGANMMQMAHVVFQPDKDLKNCMVKLSISIDHPTGPNVPPFILVPGFDGKPQTRCYFIPEIKAGQRLYDQIELGGTCGIPVRLSVKSVIWTDSGFQKEKAAGLIDFGSLMHVRVSRIFAAGNTYVWQNKTAINPQKFTMRFTKQYKNPRGVAIEAELKDSNLPNAPLLMQGIWPNPDYSVNFSSYLRIGGQLVPQPTAAWTFAWDPFIGQLTGFGPATQLQFVAKNSKEN